MVPALVVIGLLLAAAAAVAVFNIKIVSQTEAYVIERLGMYKDTWETGVHVKVPVIDRIAKGVTLKEQVADFEPWLVITKDNVTITIDAVVFFQIINPMQYTYGVERPLKAIENLTSTILRSVIGSMDLDETLSSRGVISTKVCTALDEATEPWGIKVHRVEVQKIQTPPHIQEAMETQMKADRDRRATLLRADAEREAQIRQAQGMAEAIRLINEAAPGQAYLTMESLKAFGKAAEGQATKIVIPSDIAGIAGLAQSLTGIMGKSDEANT